jgi:type VI secretion system protein ImpK
MSDDGDRTVIRPMPGGGQRPAAPASNDPQLTPAAPQVPPSAPQPAEPSSRIGGPLHTPAAESAPRPPLAPEPLSAMVRSTGQNPIIDASIATLVLIQGMRSTMEHPDIPGLHSQLTQQITEFENVARAAGEAPEIVTAARYCLCTALDEAVMSTPWGANSNWNAQSLLATFHKETWGGEKVFQILENAAQDTAHNLNLVEFIYVILCLGFEGKYRVMERGHARLEELRMSVFERLRPHRGEFERELSPNWRSEVGKRVGGRRAIPLWVVAALAGAVIATSYSAMRYVLEDNAEPVNRTLQAIENPKQPGGS